mmetsp:Transcript_11929/g.32248  ORF Transcript_11929/g.32248 Transcript_11929/m.32248 type:complete len:204 (+) Transcript_11929:710-1321(+)
MCRGRRRLRLWRWRRQHRRWQLWGSHRRNCMVRRSRKLVAQMPRVRALLLHAGEAPEPKPMDCLATLHQHSDWLGDVRTVQRQILEQRLIRRRRCSEGVHGECERGRRQDGMGVPVVEGRVHEGHLKEKLRQAPTGAWHALHLDPRAQPLQEVSCRRPPDMKPKLPQHVKLGLDHFVEGDRVPAEVPNQVPQTQLRIHRRSRL